jgi:hypothetical protein
MRGDFLLSKGADGYVASYEISGKTHRKNVNVISPEVMKLAYEHLRTFGKCECGLAGGRYNYHGVRCKVEVSDKGQCRRMDIEGPSRSLVLESSNKIGLMEHKLEYLTVVN